MRIQIIVLSLILACAAALALHCGGSSGNCLPAGNYTFSLTKQSGSDMQCTDVPPQTVMIGGMDAGGGGMSCQQGCTCQQPAENACSGTLSQSCPSSVQGGTNYSCSVSASGTSGSGSCTFMIPTGMSTINCNYSLALSKQ
jgi:hypothetical protein